MTEEKLKQRRAQIVIHSCLYYFFDEPIISDSQYDEWCKELVELQNKHPNYSDKYDRYFEGFDGSTGYFIGNINNVLDNYGTIKRIMSTHTGKNWTSDKIKETNKQIRQNRQTT